MWMYYYLQNHTETCSQITVERARVLSLTGAASAKDYALSSITVIQSVNLKNTMRKHLLLLCDVAMIACLERHI